MQDEADINKAIAEFASLKLAEISDFASDKGGAVKEQIQLRFKRCYTSYLTRIADRYGKT